MIGRALVLSAVIATVAGCGGSDPGLASNLKQLEFGTQIVRVSVPAEWMVIDHGAQKRFRKGEYEVVLQTLKPVAPAGLRRSIEANGLDELVDWGMAELGHDQRREVKSRRAVTIDGREAVDVETWQRLDHTFPLRMLFVTADDGFLVLHTPRMANEESIKAFELIRDSLHFEAAAPAGSARR